MADSLGTGETSETPLNLTPEEKRIFGQLFQQADTDKLGVVTGEVAVKFFERTKLAPQVLGEIWQIADTENCGFLTSSGFCMVLRLIGHYQNGRDPTSELALRPGPLPKFEGMTLPTAQPSAPRPPQALQPQPSGGVRVPQLSPEKANEYASLFEKSGSQNGVLSGETAKSIFEKARLPNEVLGRIWNLADREQRGALDSTEFVIAMHLLASYKSGAMPNLPTNLPTGLYEAAARRAPVPGRGPSGRPGDQIPRQFSGQRTQSPLARPPYGTPPQSAQLTGNDWAITSQEKTSYDSFFNKMDTNSLGYITGDQAVQFFSDSGLPEDVLAQIWDLADIKSEGQLNRDEFAVAMHLIRQMRRPDATLPTTLPPNLIPPSMRSQVKSPQAAPPVPQPMQPKSASEDLFGLDAISAPAPSQQQQSTGGSHNFSRPLESDPFGNKASPTSPIAFPSSPRNTTTSTFKPFQPTSAFGQGLTQHDSGNAGVAQTRGLHSAQDDLLGDNDPEVSKRLTQETSELANMSNQIGTLKNQMQEVQSKRTSTENDINGTNSQRRDLELRLSQFRTQYEKEVQTVKQLEERLNASRNETRKLQQDCAMIEGTYQDLQNQHRQVAATLDADQKENTSLKERIRQMNAEIGQLRPQLDKMRSDARQQKGMVAINKKQLSTSEGERDKIKNEMNDLTRTAQEAARSNQGTPQETPSVQSPAASTSGQSTNPFFRRSPAVDSAKSPPASSQNQRDFDSIFGTSFASSQPSQPPPTSFKTDPQNAFGTQSGPSVRSSEPDVPTPSTSPQTSSYHESPRTTDPPAPPESRQFASNLLPLREGPPRTDSFSSSVKVSAPASRYGVPSHGGAETPTNFSESVVATPSQSERPAHSRTDTGNLSLSAFDRNKAASPAASTGSNAFQPGPKIEEPPDTGRSETIPGAFPDATSPMEPMPTGESALSARSQGSNRPSEGFSSSRTDTFPGQPRSMGSSRVDFDAAFAGFGNRSYQEKQHTGTSANGSVDSASKFNQEFPPIEDIGQDEESDSNSERGFADNFTTASPNRNRTQSKRDTDEAKDEAAQRPIPPRLDSTASSLPTPNAQKSPPTYDQTVKDQPRSGSGSFPPEFGGLLPSREDPVSGGMMQSPERSFSAGSSSQGQALFGGSSKATSSAANPAFSASPPPTDTPASTAPSEAYHSAVSQPTDKTQSASNSATKPFGDDFDSGFDDLMEAKEADEKGDDDFIQTRHRDNFDEFNPVFDSPAPSKSNTIGSQQTETGKDGGFADFDFNAGGSSKPVHQPTATSAQDWDAIFSNLDSQKDLSQSENSKGLFPPAQEEHAAEGSSKSQMPHLGRAISTGTEHDDPILKKLTGMGYQRTDALDALEKFDYDINKAVDHLAAR